MSPFSARRPLALLCTTLLALTTAVATAPTAAAATTPERVLLSPTADPATSQTLTWRSDTSANPTLQIAPASAPGQVTTVAGTNTASVGGTFHRATATGLAPDTAYRYRVGDGTDFSPWRTFTTAASDADPFTFLYFGDVQNGISSGAAPVVRAALAAEPDAELAVHAGDLVDSSNSEAQWTEWFEAFGPEATGTMNHVTTPGNHEYSLFSLSRYWTPQFPGAGNGPTSGNHLPQTVYHTDYQGVRFIVLNSNYRAAAPLSSSSWLATQQRWLEQALAGNPHPWTVVTFHHPVFSNSPSRDNAALRRAWLDTLESHDVDLVLQGHDHSYARGNLTANRTSDPAVQTGPVYTVAVTGTKMYGASTANWTENGAEARVQLANTQTFQTVRVDGARLHYTARTADGTVVDSFTIDKTDGKRVTDTL
ncbi:MULTISPECIES: metallophosphoesterase family protein [unclassified Nocardiopsis]|uniref:purple acid phosphatase family protein n=1 Tax=unclassified Nocardiopsis TaxID=2649073 RepID=UPI00135C1AD4|nr:MULTISPECIES: metallophosphoesterase family protein [unclassified Nocardiopsis]